MPDNVNKPVRWFTPGELVFLVEHAEEQGPSKLQGALGEILVGFNDDLRLLSAVRRADPQRVLSFPRPGGGFQSMVFVEIRDSEDDDAYDKAIPINEHDLQSLIGALDEGARAPSKTWTPDADFPEFSSPSDFAVRAVGPNWYSAATPGAGLGTGGPGSRPIGTGSEPTLLSSIFVKGERIRPEIGKPTTVAILDTVPSMAQMKEAYDTFGQDNPLLQKLLSAGGAFGIPSDVLQITYDSTTHDGTSFMDELNDDQLGVDIQDHDYDMADHGLFSAGIVHQLAPEAQLHLIQVLNKYGVGTVETIARGLKTVLDKYAKGDSVRCVVNCSFMLVAPRLDASNQGQAHQQPSQAQGARPALVQGWNQVFAGNNDRIYRTTWVIEWLCNLLHYHDILVVGAAGNDRTGANRPVARYPAAYGRVVGVAALEERGQSTQIANYSNIADSRPPLPLGWAVIVFGGLARALPGASALYADEKEGIASVYTSPTFPPRPGPPVSGVNTNGWARWAGTSFSTPVISTALALLRSQGFSPQQAIDKVRQGAPIPPHDERIVDVH